MPRLYLLTIRERAGTSRTDACAAAKRYGHFKMAQEMYREGDDANRTFRRLGFQCTLEVRAFTNKEDADQCAAVIESLPLRLPVLTFLSLKDVAPADS